MSDKELIQFVTDNYSGKNLTEFRDKEKLLENYAGDKNG